MKMEKVFLSLSLFLALSVTSFAMPPETDKQAFDNDAKVKCAVKPCQSEIFVFLGLAPDFKKAPNIKEGECFNFRFLKDLSPEQRDKIKQIKETNKAQNEKTIESIKAKFEALDKELSKAKYSKKTITKLTKEITKLSNKKLTAKITEKQQIRDAIGNEQYKKMIQKPGKYDRFAQYLDLSQEQQDLIEKMFETNREKMDSVKKDLMEKKAALEQEFAKEDADFDVINDLSIEVADLSKAKFQIITDTKTQLKKILTNEQYKKLTEKKGVNPIPVPEPVRPPLEEK